MTPIQPVLLTSSVKHPEMHGFSNVVAVELPRQSEDLGVEEGQVVDALLPSIGGLQDRRDGVPDGPTGAVYVLEPTDVAVQEPDGECGHVAHGVHGGRCLRWRRCRR